MADTLAIPADIAAKPIPAATPSMPAAVLSRESFAAFLEIGQSTFDRLRACGKIGPRPFKIGGSLRWLRSEAEVWIQYRDGDELYDAEHWQPLWQTLNRNNRMK